MKHISCHGGIALWCLISTNLTAEELPSPPETPDTESESEGPVHSEHRANGALFVETLPAGARVYIGYSQDDINAAIGETPLETELPAGTYFLRTEREGFAQAVAKIEVRPDEDNWMRIQLVPENVSRRSGLRLAGNLLLWPGLVAAGTGIGLIVAGNQRGSFQMGKAGYGIAAAGVVMTVSGGIILGLTYQNTGMYAMPTVAAGKPLFIDRRAALWAIKSF